MYKIICFSLVLIFSLSALAEIKTPKCFPENPGSCNTAEEMRVVSDYKPNATDPGCCYVESAWSGPLEGKASTALQENLGSGRTDTQVE